MTRSTDKTRLMVGLFNTADGLKLGLDALRAGHLDQSQIKVIAPPHAFNGMLDTWSDEPETRGFSTWIVCTPSDGPIPWALAPADRGSANKAAEQDTRSLLRIYQALQRSARQLDYHLRSGGALLLVEPHTDEEERAAGSALLNYASGGVQSHEISRQR